MEERFADTNYWFALFVPRDALHQRAITAASSVGSDTRIVTSDLVVIEVLNSLSSENIELKSKAVAVFESLWSERNIIVVPCSRELMKHSAELYLRSSDKSWSFVDCSSFVIMRERKIHSALTYDHHYEQAGFRALLRER